jgi:thymidine kinase
MTHKSGNLTVICGPMFSGKTEELLRRIRRAQYGMKKIQICKHATDDRYEKKYVISHLGDKIEASLLTKPEDLLNIIKIDTDIIAIDEIQFFGLEIISTIIELRDKGFDIIISGLDLDFRGIPFGPMPYLLALADEVIKLKAVCFKTGKEAQYSQRLINGNPAKHTDPIILVAAIDFYQARSREAFEIDYIPLKEYLSNKH